MAAMMLGGDAAINNTRRRAALLTIFFIYILTVLWYTVFKRNIAIHNAQFELFWSYKKWFAGDTDLGQEIIANIVMFIPFGFLMSARCFQQHHPSKVVRRRLWLSVARFSFPSSSKLYNSS